MTRDADERGLSELRAPRRTHYFDGQLLTAADFAREQDYHRARDRLLNRLAVGYGVVSGLEVSAGGGGVSVSPGLAIDGWGRVIVVPGAQRLAPLLPTDDDGKPREGGGTGARLVVSLCFREEAEDDAARVETFVLRVREGAAPRAAVRCVREAREAIRAGRLHEAACALAAAVPAALPEDPCVPLANVRRGRDGSLRVDDCAPRPLVAANAVLLALIACLAERTERRPARSLRNLASRLVRRQPDRTVTADAP